MLIELKKKKKLIPAKNVLFLRYFSRISFSIAVLIVFASIDPFEVNS